MLAPDTFRAFFGCSTCLFSVSGLSTRVRPVMETSHPRLKEPEECIILKPPYKYLWAYGYSNMISVGYSLGSLGIIGWIGLKLGARASPLVG